MLYALEAAQNLPQFAGLAAALADVYVLKVAEVDQVFAQLALVCTAVLDFLDFVAHRLMITAVLFATSEQVLTV
jgi:hypothetical protein